MAFLRRVNLFWLGAGGLLTFFGADEIVAFRLSRVPKWLGGPMMEAGALLAVLVGLVVLGTLAIEPAVEQERQS